MELISYPAGNIAENYTIPDSVVASIGDYVVASIGRYAFQDCSKLKSITIGSGVTSIGSRAFQGCTLLTKFNFLGQAPTVGTEPFANVALSAKALVTEHNLKSFGNPPPPVKAGANWYGLIVALMP